MESAYHIPVMLEEVIEGLAIKPSGTYVDCTFGGGGHSKAILERLDSKGKLIAFDQDEDAIKNLPKDDRVLFIPQNFRHLQRFLKLHKISKVDGLLADLGVSSYQFDEASRGFSTVPIQTSCYWKLAAVGSGSKALKTYSFRMRLLLFWMPLSALTCSA